MHRPLFLKLVNAVKENDGYFTQKRDAAGRVGLSGIQKITAAMRQLAYGTPADAVEEYIRIGETTAILSLKKFCASVIDVFGGQYLRAPTNNDVNKLLDIRAARGLPGMLGSVDCMHWTWKIVRLRGKDSIPVKKKNKQLSSKLLLAMTCGYGMLFLACPGHIMISTYSIAPLYPQT